MASLMFHHFPSFPAVLFKNDKQTLDSHLLLIRPRLLSHFVFLCLSHFSAECRVPPSCSLSDNHHLPRTMSRGNNKFKCVQGAAPLAEGKHCSHSNMSNEGKKGERVRDCGGVCSLMKVCSNGVLCWDQAGPLSAC